MNRRGFVSYLGFGALSFVASSAWASKFTILETNYIGFLNESERNVLTHICNTIIPKDKAPGAVEVGVPNYINRMLNDCMTLNQQNEFRKGLKIVDELALKTNKLNFVKLNSLQRAEILNAIAKHSDSEIIDFFKTIKQLTIKSYCNSEYYLSNIAKFEFAPGRYLGCENIK